MTISSRGILDVLLIIAFAMIAGGCAENSNSTSTPDKTPPTLVATTQANNSANVTVNTTVSATFSEGVNIDGFTLASKNGATVAGTVTGKGSATLSFTPANQLNYGTTYTATITNIQDWAGNAMGNGSYSWSFTTTDPKLKLYVAPDSQYQQTGQYNSIAVSPVDGKSYITYFNETNKSLTITSTLDGSSFDDPYTIEKPEASESVGTSSSLAIDASGALHVSYYHGTKGLRYATNITGQWKSENVDAGSDVGTFSALTLDNSGKVHISYYDSANKALKYATNKTGTFIPETIDNGLPGDDTGRYSSIKVGSDGRVHISYYDYRAANSNGNLKYVYGSSGAWILNLPLETTGDVGEFSSIALNRAGKVFITYNHQTSKAIRIITNASNSWKTYSLPTSITDLTTNTLAIDGADRVHVSYYSGGTLYYAIGNLYDTLNNKWEWASFPIDTVGTGRYSSLALGQNGKVRISYYDPTDYDLKFAYQYE